MSLKAGRLREVVFFLVLTLVVACYFLMAIGLMRLPLEYDEAFNMTVAKNLGNHFLYGTNGALGLLPETKLFDPLITTGPTLLVPSALVWFITQGSITAVRLVPFVFFLAYLVAIWLIPAGRWNSWTRVMSIAAPLAIVMPTRFEHAAFAPTRLVGETTAACLLLWGLHLLMSNHWFLGGLLWGLAAQTKYVIAIPIASALIVVLVALLLLGRRIRLKAISSLGFGILLPTLVFESIRAVILGIDDYVDSLGVIVDYSASVVQVGDKGESDAMTKMTSLGNMLETHSFLIIAVASALAIGLTLLVRAVNGTSADHDSINDAERNGLVVAAASLVAGISSLLFWILVVQEPSGRHSLIGLLLIVPGIACLAQRVVSNFRTLRNPLISLAVIGLLFVTVNHISKSWQVITSPSVLEEQRSIVTLLSRDDDAHLDVEGWWQRPEFQVLGDLPIENPGRPPQMLIFDSIQGGYEFGMSDMSDFETTQVYADKCLYVVHISRSYVLCRPS